MLRYPSAPTHAMLLSNCAGYESVPLCQSLLGYIPWTADAKNVFDQTDVDRFDDCLASSGSLLDQPRFQFCMWGGIDEHTDM